MHETFAIPTGDTTIESTSSAGVIGNGDSLQHRLSADASRLFFTSEATNLVPGDSNFTTDAFVRDVATNLTLRLSTDSGGGQATGETIHVSTSDDGNYASITSIASVTTSSPNSSATARSISSPF